MNTLTAIFIVYSIIGGCFFGLVAHKARKKMAEGFINDRKGGNYEYINGYFYSWVYHRRLLFGLDVH